MPVAGHARTAGALGRAMTFAANAIPYRSPEFQPVVEELIGHVHKDRQILMSPMQDGGCPFQLHFFRMIKDE